MIELYDYTRWANFSKEELVCQHTGGENPNTLEFIELLDRVQELRTWAGIPFKIKSGYRSPSHPIEARKVNGPGQHSVAALDLQIPTQDCHRVLTKAFEMGFTGVGVNLTGAKSSRFIHLDLRKSDPRVWSY